MDEFLREQRLRWFGRIEIKVDERAEVKTKKFVVDGSKGGRPKKIWKKIIEKDMLAIGLKRSDAQNCRFSCKNRPTPRFRQKEAVFLEDEVNCEHCWNKWLMMDIPLVQSC